MASEIDEIDVVVADDGCMLADNWHSFACDACDFYHFVLFDRRGKRFAVMMVPPDDLAPLARCLMEHAATLEKDGKLTLPKVN